MAPRNIRDTYRHGDVANEAVRLGLDVIRSHGDKLLSIRKLAQKIGIAHRSIYNHFADREALLDAIAERGYLELGELLKACRTRAEYVRVRLEFALDDPHLYDLLQSRPHATLKLKPRLQAAAHVCIGEALRLFSREGRTSDENRRAVMKVLMLLHGGISLYRSGILDVSGATEFIAELQAMIETEN